MNGAAATLIDGAAKHLQCRGDRRDGRDIGDVNKGFTLTGGVRGDEDNWQGLFLVAATHASSAILPASNGGAGFELSPGGEHNFPTPTFSNGLNGNTLGPTTPRSTTAAPASTSKAALPPTSYN